MARSLLLLLARCAAAASPAELLAQYRKDVGSGKAHSKLQKRQKQAGSLEAMYEDLAPRRRS